MPGKYDGATLQRDGKTYAVSTRTPGGLVTPEHLERVAAISRRYSIPLLKITSGQRIALVGVQESQLEGVFRDLGADADRTGGPCLHFVQACLGTETCRFGNQDSLGLARQVEAQFREKMYPVKLKIGVSGCPRSCGESHTRDVGILGTARGWTVIFGGNGGTRPRLGDVIARNLSTEEALDLVERLLEYYRGHANRGERTARFMERVGMGTLNAEVLAFVPYLSLGEMD